MSEPVVNIKDRSSVFKDIYILNLSQFFNCAEICQPILNETLLFSTLDCLLYFSKQYSLFCFSCKVSLILQDKYCMLVFPFNCFYKSFCSNITFGWYHFFSSVLHLRKRQSLPLLAGKAIVMW